MTLKTIVIKQTKLKLEHQATQSDGTGHKKQNKIKNTKLVIS